MLGEKSALEVAKAMLNSNKYHDGFAKMLLEGLADYTIEPVFLKP
tara:strand:+ start:293 stop:427 length:135 start_codon:yes stop_codon:yes gene_type:complete